MSYGPSPSLVGTLFTNASNSPLYVDPSVGGNTCSCVKSGGPGGGGGTGGGGCSSGDPSCSCDAPPGGGGQTPGQGPTLPLMTIQKLSGPMESPDFLPYNYCLGGDQPFTLGLKDPCQVVPLFGYSASCVVPSTRIALFPQGCLMAGEVQAGDLLLTRRADGTVAGEAVMAVQASTQPCLRLETEDGRQLRCSLSHEVMVADPTLPQGRRTVVSALTLADRLLAEDGTPVALLAIAREPDGTVIRISLSGPEHTYLSDGLWSHNKSVGWPVPPT